ncbi:MAG: hypothetical protein NTX50_07490 [Candidatus Sumerlaeota bacterium]|nr:hypothetical protein [Candidatus Sumerlaeota bacterium]
MESPTDSREECAKYRPQKEYAHFQELADNLPYIVMAALGGAIFLLGWGPTLKGWGAAALYVAYSVAGAFWIIVFVCPYCQYFGTRTCPCGYGQIAAKLRAKSSENLFIQKFKKHIPVIVPLWIIPVVAGITFLIAQHNRWLVVVLVAFIIDSFAVLPLVARIYGCAHCPQKADCPWMGGEKKA